MNSPYFSFSEAKQADIVEYLEKLGHQPQKIRNNEYWYLSPLREEKVPSFKVNRKLNAWYDHGQGKGGNLIDFGVLYHRCSVSELLKELRKMFSFHPQTLAVQQLKISPQTINEAPESKLKIIAAKPLTNPTLCRYLGQRKIPFEIAEKHCKEVEFELYDKRYFVIGFENRSGGFELRNQHFKGSSSPKDITVLKHSGLSNDIVVCEGFFSFLSYQALHQKNADPQASFLVLNSLSFLEKSRAIMEEYEKIYLHLDRDPAGIKQTQSALRWDTKYIDKSHFYKNYKDLNDYLVRKDRRLKQGIR